MAGIHNDKYCCGKKVPSCNHPSSGASCPADDLCRFLKLAVEQHFPSLTSLLKGEITSFFSGDVTSQSCLRFQNASASQ